MGEGKTVRRKAKSKADPPVSFNTILFFFPQKDSWAGNNREVEIGPFLL